MKNQKSALNEQRGLLSANIHNKQRDAHVVPARKHIPKTEYASEVAGTAALTTKDVAWGLQVSTRTVYRLVEEDQLHPSRALRTLRFDPREVASFIQATRSPAVAIRVTPRRNNALQKWQEHFAALKWDEGSISQLLHSCFLKAIEFEIDLGSALFFLAKWSGEKRLAISLGMLSEVGLEAYREIHTNQFEEFAIKIRK